MLCGRYRRVRDGTDMDAVNVLIPVRCGPRGAALEGFRHLLLPPIRSNICQVPTAAHSSHGRTCVIMNKIRLALLAKGSMTQGAPPRVSASISLEVLAARGCPSSPALPAARTTLLTLEIQIIHGDLRVIVFIATLDPFCSLPILPCEARSPFSQAFRRLSKLPPLGTARPSKWAVDGVSPERAGKPPEIFSRRSLVGHRGQASTNSHRSTQGSESFIDCPRFLTLRTRNRRPRCQMRHRRRASLRKYASAAGAASWVRTQSAGCCGGPRGSGLCS